jgi:hypothetical protein
MTYRKRQLEQDSRNRRAGENRRDKTTMERTAMT